MRQGANILGLSLVFGMCCLSASRAQTAADVHVVTPLPADDARQALPLEARLPAVEWRLLAQANQPGNGLTVYAGRDRLAVGGESAPYLLIQPVPVSSGSGTGLYRFIGGDRHHILIGDAR